MVTSEIREYFHASFIQILIIINDWDLDKTQVKLFPNFTSIPFIRDRIDRDLHSLERLELKFGLSSEFFDKIPVRILLDVLFRVFRFSKASFYALTSSFMTF